MLIDSIVSAKQSRTKYQLPIKMKWVIICVVLSPGFTFTPTKAFQPKENLTKDWPCPSNVDFLPCTCTSSAPNYEFIVDCSNAKTDEELTEAFTSVFPFKDVYSLTIDQSTCQDCDLQIINQQTFGQVYFKYISIVYTGIETIGQEAFGNSHSSLIDLTLSNNKLKSFPVESLSSYTALTNLYLDSNQFDGTIKISNIESASLQILDLSNNPQLAFETASVVRNCPMIQEVNFSNGNLSAIPVEDIEPIGMFSGLEYIETVSFKNNHIQRIQSDTIVADKKTFLSVDLSGNEITEVHELFVSGAV